MTVLFVAGVAVIFTILAYMLIIKLIKIKGKIKPVLANFKKVRDKKNTFHDWLPTIGALAGLGSAMMLVVGTPDSGGVRATMASTMFMGMIVGYTAKFFLRKEGAYSQLQQTSSFFKALSVRLEKGYNIPYSLKVAVIHAPMFQPAVYRCIQRWSYNPSEALDKLAREMNVPEAKTLFYVLKRAYEAGGESVANVLKIGAKNIDSKLAQMEEKSFAAGKMRYLLYRMLPALTIFGIIAGSMGYTFQARLGESINFIK